MASDKQLTLYSSHMSDCSARVRIALNLKRIPYKLVHINLGQGENLSEEYGKISPTHTVPTLLVKDNSEDALRLNQSIATLEYLEDAYPDAPRLLPPLSQPNLREKVRTLVGIVALDIHPLTTHRVGNAILELFPSQEVRDAQESGMAKWRSHWITKGLSTYENTVKETCGKYSVGDEVTMADVVLVPGLWTGMRIGVDLKQFPIISRILANLSKIEDIGKEHSEPE